MTPAPADLTEELSSRGIRVTRQRVEVLRLVRALDHPTVAQVHRQLARKVKNVSKKTVYSVLETLIGAGLASVVTAGGEPYRYEGKTEPHFHAQCRICGALVDLPAVASARIRGQSPVPEGFEVEQVQVTLVGLCRRCSVNR